MKWNDHFILFGIGLVIIIGAFILFAQFESFDFNKFLSDFSTNINESLADFGLSPEVLIVFLLFLGGILILKAMK